MVKHNNQVPNLHFHKKYCESSRGPLKVKLALNQASRKKSRRIKRAAKAAKLAPAPLEKLRPVVHCPTQKYNSKTRLGRGFTMEELKVAGLHPSYAQTVGIAIDWRRRNKSEESLNLNVERLKTYISKLVILKKGEAAPGAQVKGVIQPIPAPDLSIQMQDVTDELKSFAAYTTMRLAKQETRLAGKRHALAVRKSKE
jgi:large subunit ribosomal protein L13e